MDITGYQDIADFIRSNYPSGSRIVEVGVGRHPEVALLLKNDFDVICTDIHEEGPHGLNYVRDDIFNPDMGIYEGASLVYSIRPPVDMQDSIAAIARKCGADLIIRPFSTEKTDLRKYFRNFRCVNYKSAVFFYYKKD
ncbi:hypothetical protein CUJ83_05695 [Methanocella sp. CWC-04]|uniref:UPF0146 protein CUJ83_05695 n=1 Tax=Methanooceanicella nereidis TaxID=2052831 RepID=A0AAP2W5U0_9EURY|nr:UPF0146 family protein [Methanocella sp. CWC-04]MCD1294492.1 hypothetical protein [Methanocella sp. CWC-04]